VDAGAVCGHRADTLDEATLATAGKIIREVAEGGEAALRTLAERFGDRAAGEPLVIERADLLRARDRLPTEQRALLESMAERINAFATAQRAALREVTAAIPGGTAGHHLAPVASAGCYAPGGRYPLPSTVLMTAVTARAAGVGQVVVATPNPSALMLAAAGIAGADRVLAVGGAQAIAAMAHGVACPRCDLVVGPGNRYVTAAKKVLAGTVGIDGLAGPSEVLVIADATADAGVIAADLLAQAEHDPDAAAFLVTTQPGLVAEVNRELERQLADLPTAGIARRALRNGAAVVVADLAEAAAVAGQLAPEHLQVMTAEPEKVLAQVPHYGAAFLGSNCAEVFGDYGLGPNHTLPTAGAARFGGGLSVLTFLRVRTWMRTDHPDANVVRQVAAVARLEGLEAHARAAEARLGGRAKAT
jgi:histidinol dehydrogenase